MYIRGVGGKCTSLHRVLLLDKAFIYSKEAIVRLHHKALMREGAGVEGSHNTSSIMICTGCLRTVIHQSPPDTFLWHATNVPVLPGNTSYCSVWRPHLFILQCHSKIVPCMCTDWQCYQSKDRTYKGRDSFSDTPLFTITATKLFSALPSAALTSNNDKTWLDLFGNIELGAELHSYMAVRLLKASFLIVSVIHITAPLCFPASCLMWFPDILDIVCCCF